MTPVVHSSHRGRDVVLSRRAVSPHVLGPKRLLARRLLDSLPPAPAARDWLLAAERQAPNGNLGVMLNDHLGCCTISATGHAKQIWTANNGLMLTPSDASILLGYEKVDGYVNGDPATDNGGVITDVMAAWKKDGVAESQIDDWIPISAQNLDHLRKGIDRYGFVNVGISLPLTAQNQEVWTAAISGGDNAVPGSWGGHDVILVAYDEDSFDCMTWGMRQKMSIDWVLSYMDESFAALCKALWCPNGVSPSGYPVAELDADLLAVGN